MDGRWSGEFFLVKRGCWPSAVAAAAVGTVKWAAGRQERKVQRTHHPGHASHHKRATSSRHNRGPSSFRPAHHHLPSTPKMETAHLFFAHIRTTTIFWLPQKTLLSFQKKKMNLAMAIGDGQWHLGSKAERKKPKNHRRLSLRRTIPFAFSQFIRHAQGGALMRGNDDLAGLLFRFMSRTYSEGIQLLEGNLVNKRKRSEGSPPHQQVACHAKRANGR